MTIDKNKLTLSKKGLLPWLSSVLLLGACSDVTTESASKNQSVDAVTANTIINGAAHWVTPSLILIDGTSSHHEVYLSGKLQSGDHKVILTPTTMSHEIATQFPHLKGFSAFAINVDAGAVKKLLKNELSVVVLNKSNQQAVQQSYMQIGPLLDALYTQDDNDADEINDFGATVVDAGVQFKLWAPTAKSVYVLGYKNAASNAEPTYRLPLTEDFRTGVWQLTSDQAALFDYYVYQIEVYHPETRKIETITTTDPYSLSLATNSTHSQVVSLNHESTQPTEWPSHTVPSIDKPEDNILYETHIRDFSAHDTSLKNLAARGKYKAFSEVESHGIKHLKSLKAAGLNNVHLLPAFDVGTINEDETSVIHLSSSVNELCDVAKSPAICSKAELKNNTIANVLASYDTRTDEAQALVSELRQFDDYNWGYDPFHYTVPEGSYASNAMGITRIVEFREMVQSLHTMGFRVIMDVVYNHTHQYGLANNSVLDKVVPGYYHRLNPVSAEVEQSTCYTCGNTATERTMMAKLMTDSLLVWARDYKIDGFRFDLMGHQPKDAMLRARDAVRQVDPDTYFYGEGWNFGEVENNSQFTQASQLELAGSEIGTFSDRLRDAVRGSGNNTRDSQGIGSGLLTLPNEKLAQQDNSDAYALALDQVRIGLAGNLANYPLAPNVLGKDVPYGNQPTGYALDPADTINYVSKHDNQTLWDNSQYRLPYNLSTADRVRLHNLSVSYVMYGQGIPFIHMGSELLRSKSFLRDSYDYGDWFNAVDFSGQSHNYDVGLPPADKDKDNWPLITAVLDGNQGRDKATTADIQLARNSFLEMLEIRTSSPLFSLSSEKEIIDKVHFLNRPSEFAEHQTGLIVMHLDDRQGAAVDAKNKQIMVIFNSKNEAQTFSYDDANSFKLHPIHVKSHDKVSALASVTSSGFTVPPLSSWVFVN